MTASKMSIEQGSMEDTWVGKLMFPAGICKDSVYVPKQVLTEKTQEKILDTPAVYLLASGYFHIYWCQELTAVILRMGALASNLASLKRSIQQWKLPWIIALQR